MKLSVYLTKKQCLPGAVLMGLSLLVFPILLKLINSFLQLNSTQLNFLLFLLNFGCTLLVFWRFLRENLRIALKRTGRLLGSTGLGLLIYYAGAFLVGLLIRAVRLDYANMNDRTIGTLATDSYSLMLIGTVILVPTAEEAIYRGLLFSSLQRTNRWLAYGLSVSVFSLIHLVNYLFAADPLTLLLGFMQYLPAGIALAWAYERADSIFAPILMHTVINLVSMLSLR